MRFCPQCSLILESVEWCEQQIGACRSCGGCWLPKAAFAEVVQADRTKFSELDSLFPGVSSSGMFEGLPKKCPDCKTVFMDRLPVDGMEGAQPSTCSQCGGKWLEANEAGIRTRTGISAPQATEAAPTVPDVAPQPVATVEQPPTLVAHETTSPPPSMAFVEPVPQPPPTEQPPKPESPAKPPIATVSTKAKPQFRSAETMPDPRPSVNRPGPIRLDGDSEDTDQSAPSFVPSPRWCPQCRRGFSSSHVICTDCGIGLVEPGYRIRCLRCSGENTISADRCWRCHAPLHADLPDSSSRLPFVTDEQQIRQQAANLHQPSRANSCSTAVLMLGIVIAALAAILH